MTNTPQDSGRDSGSWINIGKAGFQPTSQSPAPTLPSGSAAVSGVVPPPSVTANPPPSDNVRRQALLDAAKLVCAFCGGRAYPLSADYEVRAHHGPNDAGNYFHKVGAGTRLCQATAIYAQIRGEADRG